MAAAKKQNKKSVICIVIVVCFLFGIMYCGFNMYKDKSIIDFNDISINVDNEAVPYATFQNTQNLFWENCCAYNQNIMIKSFNMYCLIGLAEIEIVKAFMGFRIKAFRYYIMPFVLIFLWILYKEAGKRKALKRFLNALPLTL